MTWEDVLKETAMRLFVQYPNMLPDTAAREADKLVEAVKAVSNKSKSRSWMRAKEKEHAASALPPI